MKSLLLISLSTVVFAAACASSPGIVQLSPDTYMISKEDHAGIFGSLAKLKADTIRCEVVSLTMLSPKHEARKRRASGGRVSCSVELGCANAVYAEG